MSTTRTCATSSCTCTACSTPRRTPNTIRTEFGRAALAAYGVAGQLVSPLASPYLARRAWRGKEDGRRGEKLGVPSLPAFETRPVWLHAVSVGESVAALTLAEALTAEGRAVLLTTATPASASRVAATAEAGSAGRLRHQYAPLDTPPFVRRFLAHWRPAAALFTEGEIWPTTLGLLKAAGIRRGHVNARLSDRTFAAWRARPWLAAPLFSRIELACAQSAEQAERFAALGARKAVATGNLKFDAPARPADPAVVTALRDAISGRPVLLAASTHPGEEAIVADAHRRIAASHPALLTVVAPRHPRGDEVAAVLATAGPVGRRTLGEEPRAFYLADTMGELGALFEVADVVLLGGSLVPLGEHNPAEPAAFARPLLTGTSHGEMFAPFLAAGAAEVVRDAPSLAEATLRLLDDPAMRRRRGDLAATILAEERGALARTLAALEGFLP